MRIPALLIAAALSVPAAAQAEEPGLRLDLNIPALRLDVWEDGRIVKSYPVAVGKLGHDTPDGTFTIDHAEWNPWWRPPPGRAWTRGREVTPPGPGNPMGRVKLFFEPLYFLHGTPEGESIGSAASHGCVRLKNADAIALARFLHERASGVSSREIDRILANSRQTRHVRFSTPIPLRIRYEPVVVEEGELRFYPDLYKRNAIHAESVFQALLAAGYDVNGLSRAAVGEHVDRARKHKGTYSIPVGQVLASSERRVAR
jgi:murein L,D-transpeptidase YcbB/YkuD